MTLLALRPQNVRLQAEVSDLQSRLSEAFSTMARLTEENFLLRNRLERQDARHEASNAQTQPLSGSDSSSSEIVAAETRSLVLTLREGAALLGLSDSLDSLDSLAERSPHPCCVG